jgi:DNA-binding CsgD family transcriptional regulator
MNTLSNRMIISEAPVDSGGNFLIDISFLPVEENLFRLHLVKIDDSPNSLIIGGKDENNIFLIANCNTNIRITNKESQSLFKGVTVSGCPNNNTIGEITRIISTSNYNISLEESSMKRELIEKATSEKLRFIADTCTNGLVSLYAIYKSDFESSYSSNTSFYRSFLRKWKNNESSYFVKFREELPVNKDRRGIFGLLAIFLVLIIGLVVYKVAVNRKNNRVKLLSVQERRILTLLQKGATNQQISDEFNIGINTVKSHVSSIYSKLKIKSRNEVMNMK